MGVEPNFGLLQQQPDFSGDIAKSFALGREIGQMKAGDNALARVRSGDQSALTDLAVYNPQAANAFLTIQDRDRAAQARQAASQAFAAYGGQGMAPPAQNAPQTSQGAPVAAPQAPMVPQVAGNAPTAPQAPQGQPPQGQAPQAPQSVPPQALLQPDHPVTQNIGAAVSSGQMSYQQAIAAFAQYANPEQTQQLIQSLAGMDQLRRQKIAEASDAMASEAQALKGVPQEQRLQKAMSMLPQLAQHGVTAEMIQNADLSDAGLNGIIGQAIGAKALIDATQADRQLNQGDQRIGLEGQQLAETKRHNLAEESKPVAATFGTTLVNPQTGQPVYDGMAAGSGGDTFSAMLQMESGGRQFDANGKTITSPKGAVGIAQLMPTTGPQAALLAGVPWDPQRFQSDAQYNMQLGRAYYSSLVQKYGGDEAKAAAAYNAGPGAVDKALASGGANWLSKLPAETQNYVASIAQKAGGQSNMLDGEARAIATYQKAAPNGRETPMSIAVMNRVMQLNPNYDATRFPERNKAVMAFGTGKQGDTVRSLNVAVDHLDRLQAAAGALGNGNTQAFNGISQWFAQQTGSAIPTNFDAIKSFVMDEVTKAVVGSGGGVGDRDKAAAIISKIQSPQQLAGAIYQVKGLMAGQLRGLQHQYEDATGLNNFGDKLSDVTKGVLGFNRQVASRQPPAGATQTATGPNGAKIALVNGQWVPY